MKQYQHQNSTQNLNQIKSRVLVATNEIFQIISCILLSFSRSNFLSLFIAVDTFVLVWRTDLVQPVSADHVFDPAIFLSCVQGVSPAITALLFRIFSCCLIPAFFWPCRPEVLGLFTLSISLLFTFISSLLLSLFLDIISFLSDKKRELLFFQSIIFGIFGTGMIFFKNME